jgi:fatty acid desaturase
LFRESGSYHTRRRQALELLFFIAVLLLIGLWDPLALGYLLGVFYLGQVLAAAENYVEHLDAVPGDRFKNAVSCYSPWYNQVWFNNGYHQEHHFRPSLHWTLLPTLKAELPPESERPVVQDAHWFFWRRS